MDEFPDSEIYIFRMSPMMTGSMVRLNLGLLILYLPDEGTPGDTKRTRLSARLTRQSTSLLSGVNPGSSHSSV
jgi:hypothetical protein